MNQNLIKYSILFLALIGAVVMGYLISLHFSEESVSFCNLGEGLSCDIVNKSIYAKAFGVPISVLGFIYFAAVFFTSLFKLDKNKLKIIAFLTIVFLGPSLYLTGIELFIIKNICVFC